LNIIFTPNNDCQICFQERKIKQKNVNNYSVFFADKNLENSEKDTPKLEILSVGFNVGKNTVIPSSFIRGFEDGRQAVDFDNWLISWDDFTQSLNIKITTLPNGDLELRSGEFILRINPDELTTDEELGKALSIGDIKNKFGIECEFDLVNYTIVFNPPWLNLEGKKTVIQELPIILTDLTKINPPLINISTIGQKFSFTGNTASSSLNSQNELMAIGTLFDGSWTVKINNSNNWRLQEAQYLQLTPFSDYIAGSVQTFWNSQGGGSYWGFTTIQRFGFTPPTPSSGGFSPSQRLQTEFVGRTVSGKADPGTLVQLKRGFDDRLVAEVLVDSSGVYWFENIPTGGNNVRNYRIFLYPNGRLTAEPKIELTNFTNLPGLLTKKTSSLIVSGGFTQTTKENSFFGDFKNLRGGMAYRFGLTEDLTLGTGIVYQNSVLGLGELFYQPHGFPLQISASGLLGDNKYTNHNINISLNPSPVFRLNLNSDQLSQRFQFNWQTFKGVNLKFSGDNLENSLKLGVNFYQSSNKFSLFSNVDIDTKNRFSWSLNSNLAKLELKSLGKDTGTNSEIKYNFSRDSISLNSLSLGYQTTKQDHLTRLNWYYRSPKITRDNRSLWEFNLGYGLGSQGNGFLAKISTAIIPGVNLDLAYDGVSTSSNIGNFRIGLTTVFSLQPQIRPGNSNFERFRNEGGMIIQPFLDDNNNNRLDQGEKINMEDAELLLFINNKPLKNYQTYITKKGVFINLPPGNYRLDLDPSGYPLGRKPLESAYNIKIVAGSYTTVKLPMITSYTVAGKVMDATGKPVSGVKVEAIVSTPGKTGKSISSLTNGAGIFFLEELAIGTYNLLLNGQPANPSTLEIKPDSPQLTVVRRILNCY
jgi:hypothetical protein